MVEPTRVGTPDLCPFCGAALAGALYQRFVVCARCAATPPNPACLPLDAEVLLFEPDRATYTLFRVAQCKGPDEILLEGYAREVLLEELIPVIAAPETIRYGTEVYRESAEHGWLRISPRPSLRRVLARRPPQKEATPKALL